MKFYGLKTCDTCRKAKKTLKAAGHEFEVVDVRADGVPADILQSWLTQSDIKTLLNTRSTTWRGLADADKADIDTAKAVMLMAQHPTLIKRPVVEHDGKITVGWTKAVQAEYL